MNLQKKITLFSNSFSIAAKEKLNNKEFILDYCLRNRAWRDTVIREKFNKDSEIIKNKDNIINILKDEIKNKPN